MCQGRVFKSRGSRIFILIYLNWQSMRNRTKFDWSKPFKFVASKKEFDQMDTNEEATIINIAPEEPKPVAAQKKENIPVPEIENVPKVGEVKPFAKMTPNYIRLPAHLNLPLASHYELTEVDLTFVKTHQDRFIHKGRQVLTCQFLTQAIVSMELKAGKEMNLPRNKGWMMAFMEAEHKDLLEMENKENFAQIIYNYWKNRREELRFPLLRQLWKPNPDQYNHMLAFRPREREKRSLRRTNRIVEDEIIEELYEEFDLAHKIVDRVQMREELKLKSTVAQLSAFYAECKSFVPVPDYLEELRPDDRVKDKERLKSLQLGLESYKARKESFENMTVQDLNPNEVDQKQSMFNFLSTVVYEAELLGLSYEKIFNNAPYDKPRTLVAPVGGPGLDNKPVVAPADEIEIVKQPQQFWRFSLERFQDMLIRRFQEEDSPVYHVRPCRDYLQLKRRKVDLYYFGSDDEGEAKDLRKNISTSFKKYQQLQHITRTISATSEN